MCVKEKDRERKKKRERKKEKKKREENVSKILRFLCIKFKKLFINQIQSFCIINIENIYLIRL